MKSAKAWADEADWNYLIEKDWDLHPLGFDNKTLSDFIRQIQTDALKAAAQAYHVPQRPKAEIDVELVKLRACQKFRTAILELIPKGE